MIFTSFNLKTLAVIALSGFLPAMIWLWFWLREDRKNPEPRWLIALTFLAGGAAVFLAFFLEQHYASSEQIGRLESFRLTNSLMESIRLAWPFMSLFLGWALIEEFVKYLAATLTAFGSRHFDEPVDAMIYMITAAIGFSAVENCLFLFKTVRLGLSGLDFMMNGNLRFLGATLLHISCSALVGVIIALFFKTKGWSKIISIVVAIGAASLLHALFNFFIIIWSDQHIFSILFALWLFIIVIIVLFEKIKKINLNHV